MLPIRHIMKTKFVECADILACCRRCWLEETVECNEKKCCSIYRADNKDGYFVKAGTGKRKLSRAQAVGLLEALPGKHDGDWERLHGEAIDILLKLLKENGFQRVVKAYEELP
jgi:hypothetical protein